jgi:hypothetical protein
MRQVLTDAGSLTALRWAARRVCRRHLRLDKVPGETDTAAGPARLPSASCPCRGEAREGGSLTRPGRGRHGRRLSFTGRRKETALLGAGQAHGTASGTAFRGPPAALEPRSLPARPEGFLGPPGALPGLLSGHRPRHPAHLALTPPVCPPKE